MANGVNFSQADLFAAIVESQGTHEKILVTVPRYILAFILSLGISKWQMRLTVIF